jgi:selenocysteine lyase/cysteine desulfurase
MEYTMPFDILRARADTLGCTQVLHFNNAGAALVPRVVMDAMIAQLELEERIGGYEAAVQSQAALEHLYDAAATLLNCHRDEVGFVESSSRAWNMAFLSVSLCPGDRILTSMAEYASNYITLMQASHKTGAIVEVIANDEYGQISLRALHNALDERVKLIAITHVPTNGGLVNPAAEVGQMAREVGALYLVDACQSVGQLPVDVQALNCDILSTAGRKYLRGPRGTGLLYVRRSILDDLEPPLLDVQAAPWVATDRFVLRPDARRFESWETSYAGKIGLGVAIDYALQWGIDATWARVSALADELRTQLAYLPGVTMRDQGVTRCGIVTFTVDGRDPREICRLLSRQRINVWNSEISLTRLDMEARGMTDLIRASVHYYNTYEEIERFCSVLATMLGITRFGGVAMRLDVVSSGNGTGREHLD